LQGVRFLQVWIGTERENGMKKEGKVLYLLYAACCGILGFFSLIFFGYLFNFWLARKSSPFWGVAVSLPFFLGSLWILYQLVILFLAGLGKESQSLYFKRAYKPVVRFFPFCLALAKLLKRDEMKLRRSFLSLNNDQVERLALTVKPEELLILLPHCLQYSECDVKITHDPTNCKRCGRCVISSLLDLSESTGVPLAVVTGGTLARKVLKERGSKAVVAVACERDLSDGILDSYPLPAFGVLNDRPFGPCFNTRADLALIRKAVDRFVR